MKLLVVLSALVACVYAASINTSSQRGFAALIAERGTRSPLLRNSTFNDGSAGQPGRMEDIPYIVSLQDIVYGHICAGSIISATRILTTTSCTEWFPQYPLSVRAGSIHHLSGGQLIPAVSKVDHPSFNYLTLANDISILTLQSALAFSATVQPIQLPVQGANAAIGILARVAGWGYIEVDPNHVHFGYIPIISNAECNSHGGGVTNGMVCAGFDNGVSLLCSADIGSPLTASNQLYGIASWTRSDPLLPGIYTRVSYYRDWINSNM